MKEDYIGYPVDVACVWLGVDLHDHVAAFCTQSFGPIPLKQLMSAEFDIALLWDALERRLPVRATGKFDEELTPPEAFARRGLYMYDWEWGIDWDSQREYPKWAYIKRATPSNPLRIKELPDEFAKIARLAPVRVAFGKVDSILRALPRSLMICE